MERIHIEHLGFCTLLSHRRQTLQLIFFLEKSYKWGRKFWLEWKVWADPGFCLYPDEASHSAFGSGRWKFLFPSWAKYEVCMSRERVLDEKTPKHSRGKWLSSLSEMCLSSVIPFHWLPKANADKVVAKGNSSNWHQPECHPGQNAVVLWVNLRH